MKILTNGCFDLFHDGHKDLFNKIIKLFSQEIYNRINLIVLVNSDKSVKELKGENRPIDSITQRILNIKKYIRKVKKTFNTSIRLTVISFNNEEELKKLINSFDPDIIVKGNDRPNVKDIAGNDKYPVLFLPRTGISTTEIINNVKNNKT